MYILYHVNLCTCLIILNLNRYMQHLNCVFVFIVKVTSSLTNAFLMFCNAFYLFFPEHHELCGSPVMWKPLMCIVRNVKVSCVLCSALKETFRFLCPDTAICYVDFHFRLLLSTTRVYQLGNFQKVYKKYCLLSIQHFLESDLWN